MVEHVIGFHDVLLLRPTGTKPRRDPDDPQARWVVTVPAIESAVSAVSGDVAGIRTDPKLTALLPALTTEMLVHTWDLAVAIGVDPDLPADLCREALRAARENEGSLRSSGMFEEPVPIADDADPVTLLIAFSGRDPSEG